MAEETLVTLVYDPHRIYAGEGQRVSGLAEELAAFHAIGEILRQPFDPATRLPKTYILDRFSWEHFRSLRSAKGVRVREFTPRRQVQDALGSELPSWLTDEVIVGLKLLTRPGPRTLVEDDWAITLAEWLYPGITDAPNLQEWLAVAANVSDVAEPLRLDALVDWFYERFRTLAALAIPPQDVVAAFAEQLRESASPSNLARTWLRRRAILPLIRLGLERPLTVPGLPPESPQDVARAKYLPLPFPLPAPIHSEVSRLMRQAVLSAQLNHPESFEKVALSLNAVWDGTAEELDRWLQANPRGMTHAAAQHLATLPGSAGNTTLQRLVRLFAPPSPVSRWTDLDDSFDQWVNAYAGYIERMFYRRTLPQPGEDPAEPFAKWVKANPTVFFNHPDKGYFCVAGLVQRALGDGRPVVLVLVDALAIHVAEPALAALQSELGGPPTRLMYSFSPVPTLTEVCKEAILGGSLPEQCTGNMSQTILRRYGIGTDQLQLASHWQDAERVRVNSKVRLLVYRDNRLDEQLGTFTSYLALRESFGSIIASIARYVRRWTDEFRYWHNAPPLVVVTGDHGFTFGPKPPDEAGRGQHRCVALGDGKPDDSELRDESLTFLDRETFHLRSGYLVARGRGNGNGTMSGWTLSHGGLLPEEVIVPVIEWYGEQQALPFPDISVPDGATRDRDQWVLILHLRNNHPVQTNGGRIRVTVAGEGTGPSNPYPSLLPGATHTLPLEVPGVDLPSNQEIVFEVTLSPRGADVPTPDLVRHVTIPRARQLLERTKDQAAFEDMF
jgi:hypothetical protein